MLELKRDLETCYLEEDGKIIAVDNNYFSTDDFFNAKKLNPKMFDACFFGLQQKMDNELVIGEEFDLFIPNNLDKKEVAKKYASKMYYMDGVVDIIEITPSHSYYNFNY